MKEKQTHILSKSLLIISFLLAICIPSTAQEWHTDFGKANQIANSENKQILMVFQGSDWCAPCIKLSKYILDTDEFQGYASNHYVMLKVDFPKHKKNALSPTQEIHNQKLAEQFNKNGYFPLVVVLDKNGKQVGQEGYQKVTPTQYIQVLEALSR